MKKKILALCLVVVLAVTAVTGATLAYFTDTDSDKNVMTTGNVKIVQVEEQRTIGSEVHVGDGSSRPIKTGDGFETFEDDKKLYPYTGTVDANGMANAYGEKATINGTEYEMFDTEKNAIDKIVTVYNDGTEDCYVRTLFAFEMIPEKDAAGKITGWTNPIANGSFGNGKYIYTTAALDARGMGMRTWTYDEDGEFGLDVKKGDYVTFELDGVKYCVSEYMYNGILEPKQTTAPSLRNLYLNAKADNEWYDLVGEEYNILVLSQATQVAGFAKDPTVFNKDEAKVALNSAFGGVEDYYMVSAETLKTWFSECK